MHGILIVYACPRCLQNAAMRFCSREPFDDQQKGALESAVKLSHKKVCVPTRRKKRRKRVAT